VFRGQKVKVKESWQSGIRLLKGCEVDILEDGSLDLDDSILKELDIVICSVHSKFNLSREKQTERIIRAMDDPYTNIIGHATGRLIGRREPYQVDVERLIEAARERGCFLELNAQPDRLDLADNYCKLAKERGVKLAISTDAHSRNDLMFMRFGVAQAPPRLAGGRRRDQHPRLARPEEAARAVGQWLVAEPVTGKNIATAFGFDAAPVLTDSGFPKSFYAPVPFLHGP